MLLLILILKRILLLFYLICYCCVCNAQNNNVYQKQFTQQGGLEIDEVHALTFDHLLNTIVNLKEQSFTFAASKELYSNRFTIIF